MGLVGTGDGGTGDGGTGDGSTGDGSTGDGGTAGSDLNDDQDDANSSQAFEASSFNVSGSTNDEPNANTGTDTNINAIGTSFLDDSFGSFWS